MKCKFCNKNMPPHVYEAHLKKRHGVQEKSVIKKKKISRICPHGALINYCNLGCKDENRP